MAANEIHLEDIGTVFEVTLMDGDVIVDLTGASVQSIVFLLPDKSTLQKTSVFKTDGSDGIIQYVTIADDLSQVGKWKLQAVVQLATGTWSSDISEFKVHDNLT
jgi:hypothetical protein